MSCSGGSDLRSAFGEEQRYERIVVKYRENGIPRAKAFSGRWIISEDNPFTRPDELACGVRNYIVAETAKGNYVVLQYWLPEPNDDDGDFLHGNFHVFQNVEDIAQLSTDLACETMKRLGIEVQELDI
jgi:EXLDI family protein